MSPSPSRSVVAPPDVRQSPIGSGFVGISGNATLSLASSISTKHSFAAQGARLVNANSNGRLAEGIGYAARGDKRFKVRVLVVGPGDGVCGDGSGADSSSGGGLLRVSGANSARVGGSGNDEQPAPPMGCRLKRGDYARGTLRLSEVEGVLCWGSRGGADA